MTFSELRQALGITAPALTRLVKAGLPWSGSTRRKQFDPVEVRAWLLAHGYAEPEPRPASPAAAGIICTTKDEAARALGVTSRTIGDWLTDPTFPGRSGRPGRQDGFFPIAEIQAWRDGRTSPEGPDDSAHVERVRLTRGRADKVELEVGRLSGRLVEVDQVARFFARTTASAAAILEELPDRVEAGLPRKTAGKLRRLIRAAIARAVEDTRSALAELVQGDTDPPDDEEAG